MHVYLKRDREDATDVVQRIYKALKQIDGQCSIYIIGKEDYETLEREFERASRIGGGSEDNDRKDKRDKDPVQGGGHILF